MRLSRIFPATALAGAAASAMIGAAIVSIPRAQADTLITIPGAGPLYYPNFITELPYLGFQYLQGGLPGPSTVSLLQGYDILNHAIGENWFPGSTAQVVDYPASIRHPELELGCSRCKRRCRHGTRSTQ